MLEQLDVFIFGSYISSEKPNDIDLLIIYDSNFFPRKSIYEYCSNLINQIEEKCGLPVDVTYLSINEEIENRFVEFVKAISINDVFFINREE
ncbi:nucleotidyltransferase domain-containing protein [Paenibacillus alvei]|uniref:nucleotidyltransferase domain-containing protein n=1 Tax=Paenibacillus alvei TaxID=44250 RepID=UPI00155B20C0|nr:nucleotidyltransferase domain-containing protein [Paenibacillus alvei]